MALAACQTVPSATPADDRAAIHALLMAYGHTLDARDFEGFARLFAKDGVYIAGNGAGVSGAQAGETMRQVFTDNASGVGEPNYHLFYNEVITLDGPTQAHASSMSLFMAPGEDGRPEPVMAARYIDELVREDDQWKFARRVVRALGNSQDAFRD